MNQKMFGNFVGTIIVKIIYMFRKIKFIKVVYQIKKFKKKIKTKKEKKYLSKIISKMIVSF